MDDSIDARNTSLLNDPDDGAPKRTTNQKMCMGGLTFFIFGLCVMNSAVAALCISEANGPKDTEQVFLGLYMIMFAIIIFMYELSQIGPIQFLDNFYSKNFGFLYNVMGKGCYLFFVGLMGFGLRLKSPKSLDILAAIITVSSGVLLIIIYLAKPTLFPKPQKHYP